MKQRQVNTRAMMAAGSIKAGKGGRVPAPTDVNIKCMSMGSWHGSIKKGGLRRGSA